MKVLLCIVLAFYAWLPFILQVEAACLGAAGEQGECEKNEFCALSMRWVRPNSGFFLSESAEYIKDCRRQSDPFAKPPVLGYDSGKCKCSPKQQLQKDEVCYREQACSDQLKCSTNMEVEEESLPYAKKNLSYSRRGSCVPWTHFDFKTKAKIKPVYLSQIFTDDGLNPITAAPYIHGNLYRCFPSHDGNYESKYYFDCYDEPTFNSRVEASYKVRRKRGNAKDGETFQCPFTRKHIPVKSMPHMRFQSEQDLKISFEE